MSYFSFTLTKSIFSESFRSKNLKLLRILENVKTKQKYYSKYSKIIKKYKTNSVLEKSIFIQREKIVQSIFNGKNTIFFLPPKYGLGDVVEYGIAVKIIQNYYPRQKIALAFVYQYKKMLENLLQLKNLYEYYVSQEELDQYESHFHFTYGIEELKFQKYKRENIKKLILKKFQIKLKNLKAPNKREKKIEKISIYPFSASPLRTLPLQTIIYLIDAFSNKINIEIIMDNYSPFLKHFSALDHNKNINLLFPDDNYELLNIVKKTDFGIFIDSGPLHLAKLLNIDGVLIEGSVPSSILLDNFSSIKTFKNIYKSKYCKGPCGLTNIINYNNAYGCYESLKINFKQIQKHKNLKSLQRGDIKSKYDFYIERPVSCMKYLNNELLVKFVNETLNQIK